MSVHYHSSSEDLQTPLISLTEAPLLTSYKYSNTPTPRWQSICLVLALAIVIIILVTLVFINPNPTKINPINAAEVSSFNVSTGYDELQGSWDVAMDLNEGFKDFKYKAEFWVYSYGEFISMGKLKGQESLMHGNFTMDTDEEGFSRDKGLNFDLFVAAEVTSWSLFGWKKKTYLIIDCHGLEIEFPLDNKNTIGTLSGGAKSCKLVKSRFS